MPWMFPIIWKNLFSKPATRRYPFKDIREPFPKARGRIYFDATKCDFCGDCARVCPADAILVNAEDGKVTYDPFKCIYCGICAQTCLQQAITQDEHYFPPGEAKRLEVISKH